MRAGPFAYTLGNPYMSTSLLKPNAAAAVKYGYGYALWWDPYPKKSMPAIFDDPPIGTTLLITPHTARRD